VLGLFQLVPLTVHRTGNLVSETEFMGLIERDLSRWLAKHADPSGALVLAPPNQTTTFFYYGGVRGLGTLSWENPDGLVIAMRIVSASTPEEAKELIDRRGVTHIVLPSWDSYLQEYARMGMGQVEGTFLERLHYWRLTPWLRPMPYTLPLIEGFEGQTVTVLAVVEDQEDPVAMSRLAEYFVDLGDLERAASTAQALRRFPADFGAWVARAEVETARNDGAALEGSLKVLLARIKAGGDRTLPWDRRVALAVLLAREKHMDLAREQVRRCMAEADEAKLRSISGAQLYRLLVLGRAFSFSIADAKLQAMAVELLPADARARLQ